MAPEQLVEGVDPSGEDLSPKTPEPAAPTVVGWKREPETSDSRRGTRAVGCFVTYLTTKIVWVTSDAAS
jgi:hypothetical protein